MNISTIGIFGTGSIGASWAAFYASKGLTVRLYDRREESLISGYKQALGFLVFMGESELLDDTYAESAARLTTHLALEEWAQGLDCVQESVSESYEIKQKVFADLDRVLGAETLILSSTTGLLISKIQEAISRPGRTLIAHPFNPPHLIPLVELVGGNKTDPETVTAAREFFERLGKIPVVLKKEVPGHIANRLAAALWREAIHLVDEGVASVEDVDKALYAGPGLRWAFMGQHLIYHLGGGTGGYRQFIENIGRSYSSYWQDMPKWTELPPKAEQAVIEGVEQEVDGRSFEELSGYRDQTLARILVAIYGKSKPAK